MQLVAAKALCGGVIFLVTLVCGTAPFLLLRSSLMKRSVHGKESQGPHKAQAEGREQGHKHGMTSGRVNSLQCFACGVFLGTCLLQLLPEARQAMEAAKLTLAQDQPLTEMIVSLGFLLLLVTENVVMACHNGAQDKQAGTASATSSQDSAGKKKAQKEDRGGKSGAFSPAPCLQSSCENPEHPGPIKHGFPSASSGLNRKAGGNHDGVVIFSRHFSLASALSDVQKEETKQGTKSKVFSDPSLMHTQKSYGTVKPLCEGQLANPTRPKHVEVDQQEHLNSRTDKDRNTSDNFSYNRNRLVPNNAESAENRTKETHNVEDDEDEEGEDKFLQTSLRSNDSSLSSTTHDSDTASLIPQDSHTALFAQTQNGREREEEEKKKKKKLLRDQRAAWKSLVLLMALSLHTVFDGLMVGLQDSQQSLFTLLGAVALHKALVAASVSLSLFESHHHHPRATLTYLSLFSLVAPAGLAVGTLLTETSFDGQAQSLTSGVLQSLAAGTFMYVTVVESLQGRFEDGTRNAKLGNVALLLLGFGLVLAMKIVLPPT